MGLEPGMMARTSHCSTSEIAEASPLSDLRAMVDACCWDVTVSAVHKLLYASLPYQLNVPCNAYD